MQALPLLLASLFPAPQVVIQGPPKTPVRSTRSGGRITLPPRVEKPTKKEKQSAERIRNDADQFYRDVIDLRRSKTMRPEKEAQLLSSLRENYDDPAGMAVKLAAHTKKDLVFGLMKVVDRYGRKIHAEELHFQILSRPLGRVTERVIRTVVSKSGPSAKAKLLDYLACRFSPARKVAADLIKARLTAEDTPRLLQLSRSKKSDIRRRVVRILGAVDDAKVRTRLLQIMQHDAALAAEACAALISQGPVVVEALAKFTTRAPRGREFGYAAFALVQLERQSGETYLQEAMAANLVAAIHSKDSFLRATSAIALGTISYRATSSESTADGSTKRGERRDLDAAIVDGLLSLVAPKDFVPSLGMLQPVAREILVSLTGHSAGRSSAAWRTWWAKAGVDFVALRKRVAVDAKTADGLLLSWTAGDFHLAFRGVAVADSDLPEGAVAYTLSAARITSVVASLSALGFMGESSRPKTATRWTVELRAGGDRALMHVDASSEQASHGLAVHRIFAELARVEMWQKYRDPKTQPDAHAFWRAECEWLAANPGKQWRRLIDHILRRLPGLTVSRDRSAALDDLQSVPDLPRLITGDDSRVLIEVGRTLKKIGSSDARLLEIALLAPGDLVWKQVLAVLNGRVEGAGGALANRLFHLIGPDKVVTAIRHPSRTIAIAAMHNAAATKNGKAIPILRTQVNHKDRQTRATAIYALGELRATAARAELIAIEALAEPATRRVIWGALGRIGGDDVAPILLRAVQRVDVQDRIAALTAMGYSRSKEIIGFLAARYVTKGEGANAEYSARAEMALRRVGPLLAAPALRPHLQMQPGKARRDLVLLLGDFQDPAVVRDLIDLLENPKVGGTAARQLSEITGMDVAAMKAPSREMNAWSVTNRRAGQITWFLDALREANIRSPLQPEHLTPGSGIGALPELTRLLLLVKSTHLRMITASMLRATTGQDLAAGLRSANRNAVEKIVDRYRFHASLVRSKAK